MGSLSLLYIDLRIRVVIHGFQAHLETLFWPILYAQQNLKTCITWALLCKSADWVSCYTKYIILKDTSWTEILYMTPAKWKERVSMSDLQRRASKFNGDKGWLFYQKTILIITMKQRLLGKNKRNLKNKKNPKKSCEMLLSSVFYLSSWSCLFKIC